MTVNDTQKIINDKLKKVKLINDQMENIIKVGHDLYKQVWSYKGIDSAYRKAKGLTVKKCIDTFQLQTTEASMSAYENGKREIPSSLLIALANHLNVSTDALLKRDIGFFNDKFDNKIKKYVYSDYTINISENKEIDYLTEIEAENSMYYHLDEGLEKSNAVIAVELKQELMTLNAPKGSILIVDRSFDIINKDLNHTITCMLKGADGIYITKVGPVFRYPETRHSDKLLNSYNYFHYSTQDGEIRIAKLKEIESLFFGQIKKVIIDLDNISGNY